MNLNNLVDYTNNENKPFKDYYKWFFIVSISLLFIVVIATILLKNISLTISYVVGFVISFLVYRNINKKVNETDVSYYKKMTSKIHLINQLVYLLAYLSLYLIFKNYFIVIGLTLGLLLNRITIALFNKVIY